MILKIWTLLLLILFTSQVDKKKVLMYELIVPLISIITVIFVVLL